MLARLCGRAYPIRRGGACPSRLTLCCCTVQRVGGRFRASKAAQSRRGEAEICFPPGPPRALLELRERLLCLAALVAEERLNFRLTRKRSSAKSPLVPFVCCAAAAGSWKSNFTFPVYGEGGLASGSKTPQARSDEAFPSPTWGRWHPACGMTDEAVPRTQKSPCTLAGGFLFS